MGKTFFIILIILVIATLGVAAFAIFRNSPERIACTMEAKQCPDGSYVGRVGPNCEFAPCPAVRMGMLEGQMTIGPICPVERIDHPCKPTPEMFAAKKVFVYGSDKATLVATLTPDSDGKFSMPLPAGSYYADMTRQGVGRISGIPASFRIEDGKTTTLNIEVDTGIR